eukprot:1785621-Amphidinium_carterae.1
MYLALDRLDLAFAVNQLTKGMKTANKLHQLQLKRAFRYIAATKDVHIRLDRGDGCLSDLYVFVDADHAADKITRKSVSGFVVVLNGCVLTGGSRTQQVIATSFGESEFYSMTTRASEGIHISSLLGFFKIAHRFRVMSDSTGPRKKHISMNIGKNIEHFM